VRQSYGNTDAERLCVVSCEPPSEEDRRAQFDAEGNQIREALTKRQVVMEMSMEVWKVSGMHTFDELETLS
jgi:hypothetical protein